MEQSPTPQMEQSPTPPQPLRPPQNPWVRRFEVAMQQLEQMSNVAIQIGEARAEMQNDMAGFGEVVGQLHVRQDELNKKCNDWDQDLESVREEFRVLRESTEADRQAKAEMENAMAELQLKYDTDLNDQMR